MDETRNEAATAPTGSPGPARRRVDPVSLVAGLVFVAVAFAVFVERFWVELDPVLVAGGAVVAVGVAMMVSAVRRHHHRERPDENPPV